MDEILGAMKQTGANIPIEAGSPGWDNFGNFVPPTVDAAAHFKTVAGAMQWAAVEIAQARLAGVKEGLEMAAVCAEAYSAVNLETAGDSVLLDPVLRGHGFSPENMAASEKHQIDGLVHSSYAHAGQHLATAIRSLGPRP